ncbi:Uncharacterized protein dnm_003500 [Desulfonema magnum]|uniref:Uncharacterized protein n=1 Tax=Desulfonema magnum TaxID=45655 RepID=A0A975GK54_9BACT|nr:Uncharacterized protein dnm_003500 [Desulfonema magnum]
MNSRKLGRFPKKNILAGFQFAVPRSGGGGFIPPERGIANGFILGNRLRTKNSC